MPSATRNGTNYVRDALTGSTLLSAGRNPMMDYPDTLRLLGGTPTTSMVGIVTQSQEQYTGYPQMGSSGQAVPNNYSVASVSGFASQAPLASAGVAFVGLLFTSTYASPTFDLDQLGRLKRLKRLHLLFDTTHTRQLRYQLFPLCRLINAAFVSAVSNYREQTQQVYTQLISETLAYDGTEFDTPPEIRGVQQLTVPLDGFGCDYQFYVTSVGAESFKLAAYEIEIQPQRDKRYTRR